MSAGIKTVSLALGACFIALPSASLAQENIALDFANPNVSVDFSVLGDDGANLKTTTSPVINNDGHLIPGPKAPVSTLYITPAGNFQIAEPEESEPVETAMPEAPPVEQPAPIETAKEKDEAVDTAAKDIPAAPQPIAAPEPSATAEQEPIKETPPSASELAKEEVAPPPEPAPIAPPKEVAKTETQMPKAPPPPPEPVPAPAPLTPVADAPAEKMAEPEKQAEDEPLKLEAKTEKEAEKIAEPLSAPPPPPVVEAPTPPKVTAPLPEKEPESEAVASAPVESAPSVASIPPSGGTVGDGYSMRVLFEPDTAKLPNLARDELSALVKNMGDNENLRLQLLAYAGGADMSASVARRLSLSRALAVRSYLIESGIRSTRIDVRALGNKTTDTDSERVDITVIER